MDRPSICPPLASGHQMSQSHSTISKSTPTGGNKWTAEAGSFRLDLTRSLTH